MNTWPVELNIIKDNFKETPPKRTIRSNMDVGPAKVRRRTIAATRDVTFNLIMTDAEYNILDDFFLENDSIPFYFIHPRTNAQVVARFKEGITVSNDGGLWKSSITLEILP